MASLCTSRGSLRASYLNHDHCQAAAASRFLTVSVSLGFFPGFKKASNLLHPMAFKQISLMLQCFRAKRFSSSFTQVMLTIFFIFIIIIQNVVFHPWVAISQKDRRRKRKTRSRLIWIYLLLFLCHRLFTFPTDYICTYIKWSPIIFCVHAGQMNWSFRANRTWCLMWNKKVNVHHI